MKRQTWHLLFYKAAFSPKQVEQLLAYFKAQQNFGGFPLVDLQVVGDSQEMSFVTLVFDPLSPLQPQLQEEMAKFILMHMIRRTSNSEQADMQLYGQIMSQSITELGIEFQRYDGASLDIVYWGLEHSPTK